MPDFSFSNRASWLDVHVEITVWSGRCQLLAPGFQRCSCLLVHEKQAVSSFNMRFKLKHHDDDRAALLPTLSRLRTFLRPLSGDPHGALGHEWQEIYPPSGLPQVKGGGVLSYCPPWWTWWTASCAVARTTTWRPQSPQLVADGASGARGTLQAEVCEAQ